MSSDVIITKPVPAVEYDATETNKTYFEDREINGVMYRTQNATATFSNQIATWMQKQPAKNSYATTQNADGSISHLMVPAGTSSWTVDQWQGNGQYRVFNVKDFGAVGDGMHDDSGAINLANSAAVALGGGYIYVPPGTYLIQSMITLGSTSQANVPITLGGAGAELTTLFAGPGINGGTSLIMVANAQYTATGTTPVQESIYIEKIGFNANAASNPRMGQTFRGPIYLKLVQNCGVSDCEIFNSSNYGILISGDETHGDWPSSTIINFQILRNHINLNSTKNPTNVGVLSIRVEGANVGLIQGNTIGDANLTTATTGSAIYCPGSSDIDISDNYIATCNNGITANSSTDVVISNNRIVGPNGYGITTTAGTEGGNSGVNNLAITGNTIVGAIGSGIRVSSAGGGSATFSKNFGVSGNVIVMASNTTGPYGIHIEASQGSICGNTVDLGGTANAGIAVDSSSAGVLPNGFLTITGNTICNPGSNSTGILFVTLGESRSYYCAAMANSVIGAATPLGAAFFQMVGCVIRGNPGINPWLTAVSAPILVNNSAIPNPFPFDIWVTISGGTVSSVLINGNATGVTQGSILLPGGTTNTITVNYSGSPSWTWLAY